MSLWAKLVHCFLEGTVFAIHLQNLCRVSSVLGNLISDGITHCRGMVTFTELPTVLVAWRFLPGDPLEGGAAFFHLLVAELTWTGSKEGPVGAKPLPLLNSFIVICLEIVPESKCLSTEAAWSPVSYPPRRETCFPIASLAPLVLSRWGEAASRKMHDIHLFRGIHIFLLQTKYRERPDSIKFTTVVDSPDLVHAKNSYMHCNEVGMFSSPTLGAQEWVVLLSTQCLRAWT